MDGLPPEALDVLIQVMVRVCDDPYNRLFSASTGLGQRRLAELGEFGWIIFGVDEAAEPPLVRVFELVWVG
jgi:hypothetical protein